MFPATPSGVQVEKELLKLHTGRSLTESTVPPDAELKQFDLLMMSTALLQTCRGL